MSQEELVNAYVEGEISRRTLIRRLVAGGVALGAATAYAQLLAPKGRAAVPAARDHTEYPHTFVRILTKRLRPVLRNKKLKVRVRSVPQAGSSTGNSTTVRVYKGTQLLGETDVDFAGAGTRDVVVPLSTVKPLRRRRRVIVKAIVFHGPSGQQLARHRKRLVR